MMSSTVRSTLRDELARLGAAGEHKTENRIASPQARAVRLADGREVINLCANDYLGLASHPEIVDAARAALDRWGYGMASVRFICGTQEIHQLLERRVAEFLGTHDALLYSSCFDANGGLFETLLGAEDAVISDELNHASIVDGIRLCKATRYRYANQDMDDLERCLREAAGARRRLVVTDGVFSMDGYVANLAAICDLADEYDAMVMVDDSHAVGLIGPGGRGTPELCGVAGRVDILSGTFGKALGGASGGYVSGRSEIVETLRQRSRPYLFSNSLAPPVVGATLRALELVTELDERRTRLRENTVAFRSQLERAGFPVLPGSHPIVPVVFGGAALAGAVAAGLLDEGVLAVAFSYPVVPKGAARIRMQVSAEHSADDLDYVVEALQRARARAS